MRTLFIVGALLAALTGQAAAQPVLHDVRAQFGSPLTMTPFVGLFGKVSRSVPTIRASVVAEVSERLPSGAWSPSSAPPLALLTFTKVVKGQGLLIPVVSCTDDACRGVKWGSVDAPTASAAPLMLTSFARIRVVLASASGAALQRFDLLLIPKVAAADMPSPTVRQARMPRSAFENFHVVTQDVWTVK